MKLSPVIVFAYNRPGHLARTLTALSTCPEAAQTEVYLFADGPKTASDELKVKEVGRVVEEFRSAQPFQKIHLRQSGRNIGLAKSVISGVTEVISQHGAVIVLEDDIVVTPSFLASMNKGLEDLEQRSHVWSLSAYSPPIKISRSYHYDAYLTGRGSSWGWATWESRWNLVNWDAEEYRELARSPSFRRQLASEGLDLPIILDKFLEGSADSWWIRWCITQVKLGYLSAYPRKSLAINQGTDGSGTHSPDSTRYAPRLADTAMDFSDLPGGPDESISRRFARFHLSPIRYHRARLRSLVGVLNPYRR